MRRLAAALALALTALPGCILVAGQDHTDAEWAWNADDIDLFGTNTESEVALEARIAVLEEKIAQCPVCQAACQQPDDDDDEEEVFIYEIH